jgi:hypothetical protein
MTQRVTTRTLLASTTLASLPTASAQGSVVEVAQTLVALAIVAVFAIAIWSGAPAALRWLGRLPGDVRIERERYTLYLPIVSALVIGLVLSVAVSAVGALLALTPAIFTWVGRLPGDIVIGRGSFTLFVPITSMIVLSLLLSAIAGGISWLLRRRRRADG